jgi:hypothetical protein
MRSLSTDKQSAWIERLFERLTALYGNEFAGKYREVPAQRVKDTWLDLLAPYTAGQISRALSDCKGLKRAPNAPEFAELCRQAWTADRDTEDKENKRPLTDEEKRRWKAAQAKALNEADSITKDKTATLEVNGIMVDKYKQWAVNLMHREAGVEMLESISKEAWREVLGYPKDQDAKQALEAVKKQQEAA